MQYLLMNLLLEAFHNHSLDNDCASQLEMPPDSTGTEN